MDFLKWLIKRYYLIVGILSLLIAVVAIPHYGIIAILIAGLFAILLGIFPYFQFNSILKLINESKNKR